MPDENTTKQREQEKKKLVIEVLDKGLLDLRGAGVLASLLETSGDRSICICDTICDGCDGKCGCII